MVETGSLGENGLSRLKSFLSSLFPLLTALIIKVNINNINKQFSMIKSNDYLVVLTLLEIFVYGDLSPK